MVETGEDVAGEAEQHADRSARIDAEALLRQVRELAVELHPQRGRSLRVSLDSALDRELGFDSLTRVELLLRLEHTFGVSLPEQLLAAAETPRDLWRAVQAGRAVDDSVPAAQIKTAPVGEPVEVPASARTLPDVLDWHVQRHAGRTHVYLYGELEDPETITCAMLAEGAQVTVVSPAPLAALEGIGIRVPLLFTAVFALGTWLAAMGGALAAPKKPFVAILGGERAMRSR